MKIGLLLTFFCLCLLQLSAQPSFLVKKEGKGKRSILFIPGFSCSGDVWKETVKDYAKEYTCHVLTMPGFAGAPAEATPQLQNWVTEIAAYIRAQNLEKPIVVGHSIGGVMTLLLAARYPDLIGRIVVVDALPCLGAIMNPAFKPVANPDCGPFISRFTKMSDSAFYQMQKMVVRGMMTDTLHAAEVIHWGVLSNRETLGRIYCQFSNLDMRDSLATITCPALVLLEASFAGMKPAIEAQYHGLRTGTLSYADKGLHFIMYDDKQWYDGQLAHFIKQ